MGYPAFAYYILGVSPSSVWRWMQGQAIPETVQKRILYYLTQEAPTGN
jgi:DNA-binding transcriptional regulator YiaG